MKAKLAVLAVLLSACGFAQAGPQFGVYFNTGGWGCGVRPVCRPAPCFTPAVSYYCAPSYAYWSPAVYYAGSSSGFSTVSPLMSYTDATPVYKVPPPVALPAEPITVYPGHAFGWRR